MENGLNEKLTRVEETVSTIKNNLALKSNAPIEDVVTATEFKLKHMMNIFIQEEEPETKDGIWIKSEPFDFDEIKVDEDWVVAGNFYPEDYLPKSPVQYLNNLTVVSDGDEVYFCNGYSSSSTSDRLFKWDAENEQVVERPAFKEATSRYISDHATPACIVNRVLYLLDRRNKIVHSYLLDQEICGDDITLPADCGLGMSTDKKSLYFFGNNTEMNYKYNIKTATFTPIAKATAANSTGTANTIPFYGGKFLIPYQHGTNSGSWNIQAYDPVEDVYYNYGTTMPKWWYNYTDLTRISSFIYDNKLYHPSSANGMYIYNLSTHVNESITYSSHGLYSVNNSHCCWVAKGQIYISHGGANYNIYRLATETTPCNENTLIIRQGLYKTNCQLVSLYDLPVNVGKLVWPVQDVFYYKDGQYHTNLEVYYGNGTAWNRLK